MSAQDLYDALSQQSQIALGYLLGIVDARKGSQSKDGCFTVYGDLMQILFWLRRIWITGHKSQTSR